jgi:integrase
MRHINKLSPSKIAALEKPGLYGDGSGLWLRIAPGGSRQWVLRYQLGGRPRSMGLGSIHDYSLGEARARARAARKLALDGMDPIKDRRQRRAEVALALKFAQAVDLYLASHEASWSNQKHRAQWRSTLTTYAMPELGQLPLADIDAAAILRVLSPIWGTKPETASRVRGRIEAVLAWGIALGFRDGPNPAVWKNHLSNILPPRVRLAAVRHHPALPYAELPGFMAELAAHTGISARALRFLILTAARTGEAIGATWDEINIAAGVWTVPGSRMKAGRPHRVPLSDPALTALEALPRIVGCPYLFPGARIGRPLSNMACLELMRELRPGYVPQGFRASFKSWATETTTHAREAIELALAHRVGDAVERAYMRGDMFEKRRALMDDWARFCCWGHDGSQ